MEGNLANEKGAFLTVLILAQRTLYHLADKLPTTPTAKVDAKLQKQMQPASASQHKTHQQQFVRLSQPDTLLAH